MARHAMPSTVAVVLVVAAVALARGVAAQYNPQEALAMAYMSAAAYCSEESILQWDCEACDYSAGFNATQYIYDAEHNVAAFVGNYLSDPSVAVVSFRGTLPSSLKDWIDDLDFPKISPYPKCDGCSVHQGFYDSYSALAPTMLEELERLQPSSVYVTGHSLGAAEAALAATDIIEAGYHVAALYSFGQPRVGNGAFYQAYDESLGPSINYRVVHYADIVPHLPPESFGFHHVATEVWYQEDNVQYQVCNGSGEDPNCSDSLDAPVSVEDHLHYMGIPISRLC